MVPRRFVQRMVESSEYGEPNACQLKRSEASTERPRPLPAGLARRKVGHFEKIAELAPYKPTLQGEFLRAWPATLSRPHPADLGTRFGASGPVSPRTRLSTSRRVLWGLRSQGYWPCSAHSEIPGVKSLRSPDTLPRPKNRRKTVIAEIERYSACFAGAPS
jgi:hypothetical protein